uniref:MARVEL domain-containing protein n=1 Tax=Caenorhabditis tropicalis TaxID=1561998 RepID=A0A1I7UQL7_9PELO
MIKFYDPNQPGQFQDVPKFLGVVPVKALVLTMQLIFLMFQILFLYSSDFRGLTALMHTILIILFAFVIAGFFFENKLTIRAHYYFAILCLAISVFSLAAFILVVSIGLSVSLEDLGIKQTINQFVLIFWWIFGICLHVFYIIMVRRLVNAMYKRSEYPDDLDTTQGLFRYNRDAYDGAENAKLIYPKL